MEWIKFRDIWPSKNKRYLVYTAPEGRKIPIGRSGLYIAFFTGEKWEPEISKEIDWDSLSIIYWAELPDVPNMNK